MHRIESGGRFVEKKQRRIMHERAAEREQLPHSAGKTAGRSFAFRLQIRQLQQIRDSFLQFVTRHATGAAEKSHVLLHRQVAIEAETLRDITELPAHEMPLLPRIGPVNLRRSAGRPGQAAKHPHRRRFARAVRAEKTEDLARID